MSTDDTVSIYKKYTSSECHDDVHTFPIDPATYQPVGYCNVSKYKKCIICNKDILCEISCSLGEPSENNCFVDCNGGEQVHWLCYALVLIFSEKDHPLTSELLTNDPLISTKLQYNGYLANVSKLISNPPIGCEACINVRLDHSYFRRCTDCILLDKQDLQIIDIGSVLKNFIKYQGIREITTIANAYKLIIANLCGETIFDKKISRLGIRRIDISKDIVVMQTKRIGNHLHNLNIHLIPDISSIVLTYIEVKYVPSIYPSYFSLF